MNKPYIIYEVTPRCNNNCLYCYNVWREEADYPKGELKLSEIERLFQKIFKEVELGGITLTGGEPLLRTDIVKIASFFYKHGLKVGMATNGTLLNEEKVRELTGAGISYFEVSLVSADKEQYELLSQKDHMEKIRQAILLIKKYQARLTVSFTITKLNLNEIGKVIDLCFAFSADNIALNRFVPGGQGLKNLNKLLITKNELEAVLKIADDKAKKYNIPINITVPIEACVISHEQYPNLNFGTCRCGTHKWVIDPVGNLRTCEQNPEILGSLFEKNFLELAVSKAVKKFRDNKVKRECNSCGKFKNCGGGCRFIKQD